MTSQASFNCQDFDSLNYEWLIDDLASELKIWCFFSRGWMLRNLTILTRNPQFIPPQVHAAQVALRIQLRTIVFRDASSENRCTYGRHPLLIEKRWMHHSHFAKRIYRGWDRCGWWNGNCCLWCAWWFRLRWDRVAYKTNNGRGRLLRLRCLRCNPNVLIQHRWTRTSGAPCVDEWVVFCFLWSIQHGSKFLHVNLSLINAFSGFHLS